MTEPSSVVGRVQRVFAVLEDRVSLLVLALALVLFTAPAWVESYLHGPIQVIAIYSIVAIGVSTSLGYAGQFTLGFGAVYAVGAYGAGVLIVDHGWSPWLAFAAGTVLGGLVGTVLGLPALRLQSHYLAMVTLGFALVVPQLLLAWKGLTGGFTGLGGIERPSLAGELDRDQYYYVVCAFCVLVFWLMRNLLRSRWRLGFLAVHDDELAAGALGLPVYRLKVVSFVVASLLAGLGGALYASYIGFLSPENFSVDISILFLAIVVVGGQVSVAGPILGSAIFVLLPQYLASVRDYSVLIYGSVLIFASMIIPNGLTGGWHQLRRGLRARMGDRLPMPAPGDHVEEPAGTIDGPAAVKGGEVLTATRLSKAFGGVSAVDGVDLVVRAGMVHALIGPNGAGKTTVLNLLSGVYAPDTGSIVLGGEDVTGWAPSKVARQGLSRTFQTPRTFGHLSTADNVGAALFSRGSDRMVEVLLDLPGARRERERRREQVAALLGFAGLTDLAANPPASLPLGTQRLVELVRAAAARPSVLLLDEPAAGLSGEELDALVDMIKLLRDVGFGILLVEHHVDLVFELADQVTVIEDGRMIAAGDPASVQSSEKVIAAYLGT